MTGFARVRRAFADGELVVSVKSVNHRGLDLAIQASSMLDPFEGMIRTTVKARVSRGHVEVRVSLPKNTAGDGTFSLNREFLHAYLRAFRAEATAHDLDNKPDLNAALRIPGMMMESTESSAPEGTQEALREALQLALDELNEFRAREGAEITQELSTHNAQVAAAAREMEQLRQGTQESYQARLTDRLREIAKGIAIDPQRLAQEAAILADRSDIGEELARLKIHSAQLDQILQAGGEVGKKLDFLLQEMNRETNTILSKTNGAGEAALRITELGLRAKAAIEKVREQSLNLE
jgi:uncharacterized protein (TIGR00255 family)